MRIENPANMRLTSVYGQFISKLTMILQVGHQGSRYKIIEDLGGNYTEITLQNMFSLKHKNTAIFF